MGLVGVGRWGRLILRDLALLGVETVAVARSPESRERANRGGAAVIVGDLAALPMDLDGYVVATPAETHLDVVEALLNRGKAIFVEKPLDVDVDRASGLPSGAPVYTMQKWRYHQGVEALAQIARSGELGPLRGLELQRVGFGYPADRRVDPIWTHAPHDFAIALHVLGEAPEPVWAHRFPLDAPGGGVAALLRTKAGIDVLYSTSVAAPVTRRSIVLAGERGSAQLGDSMADHLLIAMAGGAPERRPISTDMPLLLQLKAFVEHLRGGPAPMTCLAEELSLLRAIAAMRRMAGLKE